MTKQEQYSEMWNKYTEGKITAEVWIQYCTEVLSEILDKPEVREVMIRLKHR